jgi:hypothetical protein
MNSKLVYTLCLVACLAGAGLFTTDILNESALTDNEDKITKSIDDLKKKLGHRDTEVRTLLLPDYTIQVKAYLAESKKIHAFFLKYRKNVEEYFDTNLGNPKDWKKVEGRPTPKSGQFLSEYRKKLTKLSSGYAKVLRPVPSQPGRNRKVSASFTGGSENVSFLEKWGDNTPLETDIFPAQIRFNIAEALCKATNIMKSGAQIQSFEIGGLSTASGLESDFEHITVVFTCDLPLKSQGELVQKILTSPDVLFEIEKYRMKMPNEKADVSWMSLELTLRVLMLKTGAKIVSDRIKPVPINEKFPPRPTKAVESKDRKRPSQRVESK